MANYPTLPAPVVPYDVDGSVVKVLSSTGGELLTFSAAALTELNNTDFVRPEGGSPGTVPYYIVLFLPEKIDLVGFFAIRGVGGGFQAISALQGSNDTTNGWDGTWTNATMPDGYNNNTHDDDTWRRGGSESANVGWQRVQNLNGFKTFRFYTAGGAGSPSSYINIIHLYGKKSAGETADDLVFLDAESSDAEFSAPIDFGDQRYNSTSVYRFKIKNTSATKTCSNIHIDCTHETFEISSDGVNYGDTLDIASLAPNTASGTLYVRSILPSTGAVGPIRFPITLSGYSFA